MSRRNYRTRKYTSEDLIEILKQKEKELGRTPRLADLRQAGTIVRIFGSWNEALEAAGIPIITRKSKPYTKVELIKILQENAKILKRTPKKSEIKQAGAVIRIFGSFSEGIIAAGLKPTRRKSHRKPYNSHKKISEQEIIKAIQNKAEELGRTPSNSEVDMGKLAINKFGSWKKALQKANLEINKQKYTRSEIIQLLQDYARKNNRTPQQKHIPICHTVYKRIFGSWNNALREAGLVPYSNKNDQELLEELKRVSKELGKVPTVTECHQIKLNVSRYQKRFGSWNKALELAGLPVKNSRRRGITTEQYVDLLKEYTTKLGRVPSSKEIQEGRAIINRFGSWNKALEAAGLARYKRKSFTQEDCIVIIQERAKVLGRTPKINEMTNISTIYKKFGSWNKALEAAGLQQEITYTKEKLIKIIQQKANVLGRPPRFYEIKEKTHIYKIFGSWNKALEASGLPIFRKLSYTKEELIAIIQERAKELDRTPRMHDIKQRTLICKVFGSWEKGLNAAGMSKKNY